MKRGGALAAEIRQKPAASGQVVTWWLGQHSFVLKVDRTVIYVDPYLKPDAARLVPPLLAPADVTNADLVLGSHLHADHIDPETFAAIGNASSQAHFIVPRVVAEPLQQAGLPAERIVAMDADETRACGAVQVTALPAAHEFFDRDPETGYPYLGYVVDTGGRHIYHSGDTLKYDGLETRLKEFRIDVALLPINGRDAERFSRGCIGNMTWQEAADLAGAIRPRLTVPGHFGMFTGNTVDPQPFADYMAVKYPGLNVWVPKAGECFVLEAGT